MLSLHISVWIFFNHCLEHKVILIDKKVKVNVPQLCPPGSPVHGILQARILEWVAVPFSRGSSQPRDWNQVSHVAGRFSAIWATRRVKVLPCDSCSVRHRVQGKSSAQRKEAGGKDIKSCNSVLCLKVHFLLSVWVRPSMPAVLYAPKLSVDLPLLWFTCDLGLSLQPFTYYYFYVFKSLYPDKHRNYLNTCTFYLTGFW